MTAKCSVGQVLRLCPYAPSEIQQIADLTTQADNTAGAVAEAIDYIIEHKQSIF